MRKKNDMYLLDQLLCDYRSDVEKAIDILTSEGCKEIYLFGSLARNNVGTGSDIDLAVKGLSDNIFFEVLGKLLVSLEHSVDLLCLEDETRFVTLLKKRGELVRVA